MAVSAENAIELRTHCFDLRGGSQIGQHDQEGMILQVAPDVSGESLPFAPVIDHVRCDLPAEAIARLFAVVQPTRDIASA